MEIPKDKSADRKAFDSLSVEAKAEFDRSLGGLIEHFDEAVNEIRCDVAATHGDELDGLIARYGAGAVRHYLESTRSHCVNATLWDLFLDRTR